MLVEGDDFNEPIADAVRAILDGHISLSRDLGSAGHYPAISVLDSVSRLQSKLASREEAGHAIRIREALAMYRQSEDLINLGAYAAGSNSRLDSVIQSRAELMRFLRQDSREVNPVEETLRQMQTVAALIPPERGS